MAYDAYVLVNKIEREMGGVARDSKTYKLLHKLRYGIAASLYVTSIYHIEAAKRYGISPIKHGKKAG